MNKSSSRNLRGVTVLEIIQRSTTFLAQKGVDSPRLQIELLLAHVLQMPRLKLYLNFQRELAEDELQRLRELVKRRGQREPLQHIVGSTSFCGVEIKCSTAALVPRPETELLAERAWKCLQTLDAPTVIEIGTGTGCIAIAIVKHAPTARLLAYELSPQAAILARENIEMNAVADRVQLVEGDAFAATIAQRVSLIVSNPPYISSDEIAALDPEVRDFDPHMALDGGTDGLDFYRRIAAHAASWLTPDGKVMLEFGDGQEVALKNVFEREKWVVEEIVPDYSARPRILIVRPEP